MEPYKRPINEAIKALPTPIVSDILPPSKSLAKISLPNLSVPSKCSLEGGRRIEALLRVYASTV